MARRFFHTLAIEMTGVRECRWNAKRFLIFQTVILQRAHYVLGAQEIWRYLFCRMDTREDGHHCILVKDTLCLCEQLLFAACRDNTDYQRARTHTSLVLRENIRAAVRCIMEREWGGVYHTRYTCTKAR